MTSERIYLQNLRSAEVLTGSSADTNVAKSYDGKNSPKLPNPEDIELGEIALNIADGYETISTKNENGEIVYLPFNLTDRVLDNENKIVEVSGSVVSIGDKITKETTVEVENLKKKDEELSKNIIDLSKSTDKKIAKVNETSETILKTLLNNIEETKTGLEDEITKEISGSYTEFRKIYEALFEEHDEIVGTTLANLDDSLGFTRYGEYKPQNPALSGMNVTEVLDNLRTEVTTLNEYFDTEGDSHIICSITYEKLCELQKKELLRWGITYRLVNYQATINPNVKGSTRLDVKESGADTNNGFDIYLKATSNKTLNENAICKISPNSYYFEDESVSSWVVKYSLENDENRFEWANPNGFGVIYYMKDFYGNEAPYDFKNILIHKTIDGTEGNWFTFSKDKNGSVRDMSCHGFATGNVIKPTYNTQHIQILNNIVFISDNAVGNEFAVGCKDILMMGDVCGNKISTDKNGATISDSTNKLLGYSSDYSTYADYAKFDLSGNSLTGVYSSVDDLLKRVTELEKKSGKSTNYTVSMSIINPSTGTNYIEYGSGCDATINFDVTGDIGKTDCTYKLYKKVDGEDTYSLLKDSLTSDEIQNGAITNITVGESDTSFKLSVTATADTTVKEAECSMLHVYPIYYGTVDEGTQPSDIDLNGLNKVFSLNDSCEIDFGGPFIDRALVVAVPYILGQLKYLKDSNGFDYLNGGGEDSSYDCIAYPTDKPTHYYYVGKESFNNLTSSYKLTLYYK
jgi:hypothetical protein